MAVDRLVPTSPPSNTTFQYAQQQLQEELTAVWQHVIMELTVTNTGNALTATTTPALTSYNDAKYYMLTVPAANTGNMTLNIDGLGARPLVSATNTNLAAGDVSANQSMFVYFDNAINAFRMVSGGAGGAALPVPTQQWQVLQANASLAPTWNQELYSGTF